MIEQIRLKTLITEKQIQDRISELSQEIVRDFSGKMVLMIGLLTGSFVFLADLIRQFHKHKIPLGIDFMTVSSYGSHMHSSNEVRILRDVRQDISGQSILLVDDILDTGQTLQAVIKHLIQKKPEKIKTCVMLDKSDNRKVSCQADYIGFQIPNAFVVGYGLDYDNRFRELPYIATVSNIG
jgi:hypoxanthine phosphoribosyltransferase